MPIWILWRVHVINTPCYKCSISPFLNRVLLLIFKSPSLAENIQNHCCTENTGLGLVCGKWILKTDTLFTGRVNDKKLCHWVTLDQTHGTHCSLQVIFQLFLVLCHRNRMVNFMLPPCWVSKRHRVAVIGQASPLTENMASGNDNSSVRDFSN